MDPTASGTANSDPAVSADGRYVAYLSAPDFGGFAGSGKQWVYRYDQQSGQTVRIGPQAQAAGPPSISADGSEVAYALGASDASYGSVQLAHLSPNGQSVEQVSGTANAPQYERIPNCVFDAGSDCRPSLSQDGSTLAYPATLDSRAAVPLYRISGDGPGLNSDDTLLDFGTVYYYQSTSQQTIEIPEDDPHATASLIESAGGQFGRLVQGMRDCSDLPGRRCLRVTLDFTPTDCAQIAAGLLGVRAATPIGQLQLALTGQGYCGGSVAATRAPAAPIAGPRRASACPALPDIDGPITSFDGEAAPSWTTAVNQVSYAELNLANDSGYGGAAQISFTGDGCQTAMAAPPGDLQDSCRDGQVLQAEESCTAYVRILPTSVRPYQSFITLTPDYGSQQTYSLLADAVASVIVLDRDAMGNGQFTAIGQPAPQVASRTESGELMNASEPSLSADGRYLAYTSTDPVGRAASSTGVQQVYLRDRIAGTTRLISYLPSPAGGLPADGAYEPSLSADGNRVAFATVEPQISSDYSTPARATGPAAEGQVYVRDRGLRRTVLASAMAGSQSVGGDGQSGNPSLSADGSTVAFSTEAGNLIAGSATAGESVVSHYLDGGGFGTLPAPVASQLISVAANQQPAQDSSSDDPAISADGAFVAFDSDPQLLAGGGNDVTDVFIRQLSASISSAPASISFGAVGAGRVSPPVSLTLSNAGPGPVTVGQPAAGQDFVIQPTGCATLHQQQSCTIVLSFAPISPGPVSGQLSVPLAVGYLNQPPYLVAASGTATAIGQRTYHPLLALAQPVVRSGQVAQLTGSGFPPGRLVQLSWQPGLGSQLVTADANGTFTGYLLVFPSDTSGSRLAQATVAGLPVTVSPPLLVEVGSSQPPDFAVRN